MTAFLMTASALALFGAALYFTAFFTFEREWPKSPMGQSLMTMGVGLLILSGHGVAFEVLGPDYWGRAFFVILGRALVVAALIQRTIVLAHARHDDS